MLSFFVEGVPRPQPRPRSSSNRRGVYTPQSAGRKKPWPTGHVSLPVGSVKGGKSKGWKGLIYGECLRARQGQGFETLTGPVAVELVFLMPRPASMTRRRPHPQDGQIPCPGSDHDVDNLEKPVYDSLTAAGVWKDDGQICSVSAQKLYHRDKGGVPGVKVTVYPMATDEGTCA